MKKIKINKGWYHSAGRKFGWLDVMDTAGVGVNLAELKSNGALLIEIEGKDYHLTSKEALDFIAKYNSIVDIKGMKIGVISRSILRRIGEVAGENPETRSLFE